MFLPEKLSIEVFQRQFDPEVSRSEEVDSHNSPLVEHAEEKRRVCMVASRQSASQSSSPVGRAADCGTIGAGSSPYNVKVFFFNFCTAVAGKKLFKLFLTSGTFY